MKNLQYQTLIKLETQRRKYPNLNIRKKSKFLKNDVTFLLRALFKWFSEWE